jgi:hypothetical protein
MGPIIQRSNCFRVAPDVLDWLPFDEVWLFDFEYSVEPGGTPVPVCLVAKEVRSGKLVRLFQNEFSRAPPYRTDARVLFVSYYTIGDISCHLSLGWPLPARILDLYAEFRVLLNPERPAAGWGLLAALAYHGLDAMEAVEKDQMRQLALRGGPYTPAERTALLDYCQEDVDALARLLSRMLPAILQRSLGQALLRGRAMAALGAVERNGVPIDVETLAKLRAGWPAIQDRLIAEIDQSYGCYEGRTFKREGFAKYLTDNNIRWPLLESGTLDLSDDTFKEMARSDPRIAPLRELRASLSQMRLEDLSIGPDRRNRAMLSPFWAQTGRNQPSNSKFIFGPSAWLRGLIKPSYDHGIAYLDYASQEIAIAAALSGDARMMQAYRSGDVYLAFAKQAGLAPADATKESHESVRDRCKAVVLGIGYGMGAEALSQRIGQPTAYARELLQLHRQTYPTFWSWTEGAINVAMLHRRITTVFGWPLHVRGDGANPRSIQNFPCQANAAEMLRLAVSLGIERGVKICAPVHDAVLIEAPLHELDHAVATMKGAMVEASRIVLSGFECRVDVKIVRYPDRYLDKRGVVMWRKVMALLDELER